MSTIRATPRLERLTADAYVDEVLGYTRELWAGERTFEQYVAEFRAIVTSPFGRRFSVLGLRVDGTLVASCKRYARTIRCGPRSFGAIGIGAVFTPPAVRGQGFSSTMLATLLDAERDAGTDCAYLFSDIGPGFYRRLGFEALPSRLIAFRAAGLRGERADVVQLAAADAAAMRNVFEANERRRAFSFRRTPLDWEWLRLRATSREHTAPIVSFGVRRGRGLAAYVSGRRVSAADAFVVDEFAYATDHDGPAIPALLRAAAGDLETIRGWLPPQPGRDLLPRGAVRRRPTGLTMVAPLSRRFRDAWRSYRARTSTSDADPCWSSDQV